MNTVDGMEEYGPRYKSLHYFASIHNDAGANSVCDEFHGSPGSYYIDSRGYVLTLMFVDCRLCK